MFLKPLFAILLVLAAAVIVGIVDRNSAHITSKIEAEIAQKKASVTPEERIVLLHPLPCDARVSQRGAGEPWKHRCYVRSGK